MRNNPYKKHFVCTKILNNNDYHIQMQNNHHFYYFLYNKINKNFL